MSSGATELKTLVCAKYVIPSHIRQVSSPRHFQLIMVFHRNTEKNQQHKGYVMKQIRMMYDASRAFNGEEERSDDTWSLGASLVHEPTVFQAWPPVRGMGEVNGNLLPRPHIPETSVAVLVDFDLEAHIIVKLLRAMALEIESKGNDVRAHIASREEIAWIAGLRDKHALRCPYREDQKTAQQARVALLQGDNYHE
jgi:hypothetical protein